MLQAMSELPRKHESRNEDLHASTSRANSNKEPLRPIPPYFGFRHLPHPNVPGNPKTEAEQSPSALPQINGFDFQVDDSKPLDPHSSCLRALGLQMR